MGLYLPLIIFCFSTSITPGPNNLIMLMSGVRFGIRRSLPNYLGISFGFIFMIFLMGVGFGKIFNHFAYIHVVLKYAGALYMLYLAYKTIIASPYLHEIKSNNNKPISFIEATLFQWVNPKAWMMSVGVIATFMNTNEMIYPQLIIIITIYTLAMIPSVGLWLVGGASLSRYLHNPNHMRKFNYVTGGLLAMSIVLMIFE